jgi:hypothetical protein
MVPAQRHEPTAAAQFEKVLNDRPSARATVHVISQCYQRIRCSEYQLLIQTPQGIRTAVNISYGKQSHCEWIKNQAWISRKIVLSAAFVPALAAEREFSLLSAGRVL